MLFLLSSLISHDGLGQTPIANGPTNNDRVEEAMRAWMDSFPDSLELKYRVVFYEQRSTHVFRREGERFRYEISIPLENRKEELRRILSFDGENYFHYDSKADTLHITASSDEENIPRQFSGVSVTNPLFLLYHQMASSDAFADVSHLKGRKLGIEKRLMTGKASFELDESKFTLRWLDGNTYARGTLDPSLNIPMAMETTGKTDDGKELTFKWEMGPLRLFEWPDGTGFYLPLASHSHSSLGADTYRVELIVESVQRSIASGKEDFGIPRDTAGKLIARGDVKN